MTDKDQSSRRTGGHRSYCKASLIEDVTAQTRGYTRRQVAEIVDAMLDTIMRQMASGQNVTLTGFGSFRRTQHIDRMTINIHTGEKILIPAKTSILFKPGSGLKLAVGGQYKSRGRGLRGKTTKGSGSKK